MRVFVTGATGWIGSASVDELLAGGHEVVGLARSDAAAASLAAKGAGVRRGDLDDLDALRAGAADAEAVLHLGFRHDFSDYAGAGRTERAAVAAMGEVLAGSDAPFLLASGVAGLAQGRAGTEEDRSPAVGPDSMRGGSENLALDHADRGVRPVGLRFAATTHGLGGDHGFVKTLVEVARTRGAAGYVGDGSNRWPAVHVGDAARLVRLALEQAPAGGGVVHAVAEEGITAREIAEAIGRGLGVPTVSVAPEDVAEHFGWIGMFFSLDLLTSSAITQQRYGWTPTGPTLLDDLAAPDYFAPVAG